MGVDTDSADLCVAGRIQCVDRVARRLKQQVTRLGCDRNAVFSLAYARTTEKVAAVPARDPAFFSDSAWLNHYDAVFADFYFTAWNNRQTSRSMPPAWIRRGRWRSTPPIAGRPPRRAILTTRAGRGARRCGGRRIGLNARRTAKALRRGDRERRVLVLPGGCAKRLEGAKSTGKRSDWWAGGN